MATIDDIGGAPDSLGSVPLGGPTGWAAAVRDYLQAHDTAINARATMAAGLITPVTDWEDFGGGYAGLHATRVGNLVTIGGLIRRTGPTYTQTAAYTQIATIPAGFRPAVALITPTFANTGAEDRLGRLIITTAGVLQFALAQSAAMTTQTSFVPIACTYRGA